MAEPLDHWQKRLEAHFAALSNDRRLRGLPVFALENGLDPDERKRIAVALHARLRGVGRLGEHWLVWVVYAAEQGYDYDGAEYWTSFESRTPHWTDRADRRQLRNWFTRFHNTYAGLKPSGTWAEWFSIIAWPITHALLPKDLQAQLAQALYALRYQLSTRINEQPALIGRYVGKFSGDGSSRFRNFLEQEEIAGRIILALLGGRSDEVQHSIHPLTLERIVNDLEQIRNAREWLRDARRAVETVQLKGASSSPGTERPAQSGGPSSAANKTTPPAISPRLMLRRSADSQWMAVLEFPNFRDVADLSPEMGQFLRQRRCTVAGSAGMLPGGWLLAGEQRRVLSSWPPNDQPLIQFERPNRTLEHLLQSEVRLTSAPNWLFRINPDGLAHEVIGRKVRPGMSYILVSRTALPNLSFSRRASIKCEGVVARHLVLPAKLDAGQIDELRQARLGVAQTISIWPVALAARNWDGEGFSEWLAGEVPCFAIDHDHPVQSFEISLGDRRALQVPAARQGEPTFIKLPPLAAGKYTLHVRALGTANGQALPSTTDGYVSLWVRSPRPWVSGTTSHAGLVVTVDPTEPTVDKFWEGETRVQVFGPSGRQVTIRIESLDSGGGQLATENITSLALPVTRESWERAYATFLKKERDPWALLAASSGNLVVESDELGLYRIPLHRDAAPLRWVWHNTSRATQLRLIDDHQADDPLDIRFYPFDHPTEPITLDSNCAATGYSPPIPGGLCVASYGRKPQALVVSISAKDRGLGGLLIDPVTSALPREDAAVKRLLDLVALWSGARLTGPLAADRRERVVRNLRQHVFRILCGDQWAAAETRFFNSSRNTNDLRMLAGYVGGPPAFATILLRDADRFRRMGRSERASSYAALAQRYGLSRGNACHAAVDFCQSIALGILWDQPTTDRYIANMRRSPAVLRGARLLMLIWSECRTADGKLEKTA